MADETNKETSPEENNNNNNFKNLIADYLRGKNNEEGDSEMGDKPSEFNKLNKKKNTKQRITGLASLGNNNMQRLKQQKRYGRSRRS